MDAPKGGNKRFHTSSEGADRLAYYKAEVGNGVLGPRGWYCFATYGSSGSVLYLTPEPIDPKALFSDKWKGFAGPAIQLSIEYGGTSGRFGVAQTIARVFPSHKAFVDKVIAEGTAPAGDFPSGPYPNDKLTYRSKDFVEYLTPGQTEGLGTQSCLQKNADPIRGAVILTDWPEEPNVIFLRVRLPVATTGLASVIIQQTEREATSSSQKR
jgi:hypothetical protein